MTRPAAPIRLYDFALSGHAHRVRLFLSLLGLPSEMIDVNLVGGEQKTAPFLALNPFGQVPVMEDGDTVIADSNAILVYLALRYDPDRAWYPQDPVLAAGVQRWLSVAAGELSSGPGAARLADKFGVPLDAGKARDLAQRLFGLVDAHLADRPFLVGDGPTIADVAMYSYTALAPEGGVALTPYSHMRAWLGRVESLPGYIAMPGIEPASSERQP